MNRVGCGRNAVWGGCEESLINSHFQSTTSERRRPDEGLLRGFTSDRSLGPRGPGGNARPRILSALGAGTLESFRMLSRNGSTKKHSNVSKELWQPQCQGHSALLIPYSNSSRSTRTRRRATDCWFPLKVVRLRRWRLCGRARLPCGSRHGGCRSRPPLRPRGTVGLGSAEQRRRSGCLLRARRVEAQPGKRLQLRRRLAPTPGTGA